MCDSPRNLATDENQKAHEECALNDLTFGLHTFSS
jgi:hypothetical protein